MNNSKIIGFLNKAGAMKSVLRFRESERMPKDTAAGHSWRTALMSFLLADECGIDMNKVLKMALVHDIVEAEIGNTDYSAVAAGRISKEQQKEMENNAIAKLTETLPGKQGKDILDLWVEFDKGGTKEAKYVKSVNKLETLLYLLEAGRECYSNPELISEYIKNANQVKELEDIFKEVGSRLKSEINKT